MTIEVANSLIVGQTNTPLDARTRIATLADTATVANPFVGMRVYVLDEAKSYIVKSLKDKLIGAYTVPDAQIDTVEIMPPSDAQKNSNITKPEIEAKLTGEISSHTHDYTKFTDAPSDGDSYARKAGAWVPVGDSTGTNITACVLPVPSDPDEDALHFEAELSLDPLFEAAGSIFVKSATGYASIKVFSGLQWIPFPAGGIGLPFYGSHVRFDVVAEGVYYGRARWYDGTAWSDYRGFIFPSISI